MELVDSALERCFHAGGGAGAVMTGMTLENSGETLIWPNFPANHGINAGRSVGYVQVRRQFHRQLCCKRVDCSRMRASFINAHPTVSEQVRVQYKIKYSQNQF